MNYDHDQDAAHQADGDLPIFSIVVPTARFGDHQPIKSVNGILKRNAVLTDIGRVLGLVPLKFQLTPSTCNYKCNNNQCPLMYEIEANLRQSELHGGSSGIGLSHWPQYHRRLRLKEYGDVLRGRACHQYFC